MKNDKWFLENCKTVGSNSKCLSRKIGAILVRDSRIVAQGYNGPPVGVPHCNERYELDKNLREELFQRGISPETVNKEVCPRYTLGFKSGQGLEWCTAGHAERNALINAARLGIATKGLKMYMDCSTPCSPCLIEIINSGIEEIVFTKWHFYDIMSEWIIINSNLKARTYEL